MGIEYYLVKEETKEYFELFKGPWFSIFKTEEGLITDWFKNPSELYEVMLESDTSDSSKKYFERLSKNIFVWAGNSKVILKSDAYFEWDERKNYTKTGSRFGEVKMGKTALVSVYDKKGIIEFVKDLIEVGGYDTILSTGGTAKVLQDAGIKVTLISDYTGHPEMLEGRVKTLQPKIHAGILAKNNPVSESVLQKYGYNFIDMVVVNLYPFEQTIAWGDCTIEEAIEQIDIGGPTMLRAAAKNFDRVTVVSDPKQYRHTIDNLEKMGYVSIETRRIFALQVFEKTFNYDKAIFKYLNKVFLGRG